MSMKTKDLQGKRVVVMGLGRFEGGQDAALFAARAGARLLITDLAQHTELSKAVEALSPYSNIEYRLGEHREEDFKTADVVIVNPAVPPDNRYLQIAQKAGAVLTSQVELFFQNCPAPIVGITGSNGKSTTTSLIYHLLAAGQGQSQAVSYRKVWLSGNIGNRPFLGMLDEISPDDLVVLELSSFQIEQLARVHAAPYGSIITNLTPNHLDRHGTFEAYCGAKELLFANQKADMHKPCVSFFNRQDVITAGWYEKYHSQPGRQCLLFGDDDIPQAYLSAYKLIGRFNRSNLSAALKVAGHFGVESGRLVEAVGTFVSLPDRLEFVAEIAGVRWFNDSKATTPVSTIAALEGIDQPKILIAGGYDKHLAFDELGRCIVRCGCKCVVLLGQTADKIAAAIDAAGGVPICRADSMPAAVELCRRASQPGDVVLMSPACASWDMFENYQQRAAIFKSAVLAGT